MATKSPRSTTSPRRSAPHATDCRMTTRSLKPSSSISAKTPLPATLTSVSSFVAGSPTCVAPCQQSMTREEAKPSPGVPPVRRACASCLDVGGGRIAGNRAETNTQASRVQLLTFASSPIEEAAQMLRCKAVGPSALVTRPKRPCPGTAPSRSVGASPDGSEGDAGWPPTPLSFPKARTPTRAPR